MLKSYFARRASARSHSLIVRNLTDAVSQAAARGDTIAAFAFQREIDRLMAEMTAGNETYFAERPKANKEEELDLSLFGLQWAELTCDAMHQSKSAFLIDCGDRGRATITPQGISLTGGLENDPTALLLAVRHAQLNWSNGIVATGSPEEKFKIAVAAKMLGVKVRGASIPRSRRAEAEALMESWQPQLEAIRSPARTMPPGPRRTRPLTISNPAYA